MSRASSSSTDNSSANIDFEAKLWLAADSRLGELIDLMGTIEFVARERLEGPAPSGPGTRQAAFPQKHPRRVYESFLNRFASAAGKKGGQFYTPRRVVRLLIEMLAPYKGRVDPAMRDGGSTPAPAGFVQSEKFVEAHGGPESAKSELRVPKSSPSDQSPFEIRHSTFEISPATNRRLAMMNLAIRGIEAGVGEGQADTFRRGLRDRSAFSNNWMPWGVFTRGDRLRAVRVQRTTSNFPVTFSQNAD